jgi:peptidoglycan/xylan/chitin deacetylase (PgdA/CDA1 family)
MSRTKLHVLKTALAAIHFSRLDRLVAPLTQGAGVILMLHQVTPEPVEEFEPNRILKVTPQFLDEVIGELRSSGFDIIAMDDVKARLSGEPASRPFAAFTLDDGYKDNRDHAYPVFKRHGVPFTVYVPSDFADGTGDLWWMVLQNAMRGLNSMRLDLPGLPRQFPLATSADKWRAFEKIYWPLRLMPERKARAVVADIAEQAGYDADSLCRRLVLTWDELRELCDDPLVQIGAHTKSHLAVAGLSDTEARREIAEGAERIRRELGTACRHLAYPYGDPNSVGEREFQLCAELGFETAVTTYKGLIQHSHANHMTALPRLSLNGDYQDRRFLRVLLSGAPFALLNAAQRLRRTSAPGTQPAAARRPAAASS